MQTPLSYGIGPQGGFTGNSSPMPTALDETQTSGMFGGGGMNPMMAMAIAQGIGKMFGSGGQPIQTNFTRTAPPQAMLSQGPALAAALNRYGQG